MIMHRTYRAVLPILRPLTPLLAFLLLAAVAHAQDVEVTGVRGIDFGQFYRSGISDIPYNSASAAQFVITGRKGRYIRITVSPMDLFLLWWIKLDLNITNSHCGYSTNNGVTWRKFSTGSLFQDVKIPNGRGTTGTVLVRVGGTAVSSSSQRHGLYLGLLTVHASYR